MKKFNNIKARATSTAASRTLNEEQETSSSGPTYDHSLNPNVSDIRLERVGRCWKGGKAVIRVWNALNEENPNELVRGRLGSRQDQLGGMQMYGPCATADWIGITKDLIPNCKSKQASFIIHRSTPSTRSLKWRKDTYAIQKEEVPFWELPYPAFYDACTNAFKAGEFSSGGAWDSKWNRLMNGSGNSSAAISTMKNKYFVVGHILELGNDMNTTELRYKDKDGIEQVISREGIPYGLAQDDKLQVIWLSQNAGSKVLQMCKVLKDGYDPHDAGDNPAGPYTYGDPCGVPQEDGSVKGGLLFTVFNPKVWQPGDTNHTTWDGVIPDPDKIGGYEVKVSTKYESNGVTYPASMTAEEANKIRERSKFGWKEEGDEDTDYLLNEVSVEEEATLVARAFADVPKLLEFAWMSHPEYLNFEGVRSIVRSSVTVPAPSPAPASAESFDTDSPAFDTPSVDVSPQEDDDCPFEETPEGTEFSGGEVEAELSAGFDEDFDDIAASFEEDSDVSEEFDPEGEEFEISADQAESAQAKEISESSARTSPRRRLSRRK